MVRNVKRYCSATLTQVNEIYRVGDWFTRPTLLEKSVLVTETSPLFALLLSYFSKVKSDIFLNEKKTIAHLHPFFLSKENKRKT